MPTTLRNRTKRSKPPKRKVAHRVGKTAALGAVNTIRKIGDQWTKHWNAGKLEEVAAIYAEDAVYLPPHHPAVHGRDAIREYLSGPMQHGVSELAFEITYIKQQGPVAWDVGTYRMTIPQNDGTRREDRGKYLTVWKRISNRWLIVADAWSSDLPPSS
jgi:uncharacterized protein (TIGR02246 family)